MIFYMQSNCDFVNEMCAMTADCDNVQFILHNFILFFFIHIMTATTVMPAGWKLVGDVMRCSKRNLLEKKKIFQSFKSSSVRVYVLYCRIVDLAHAAISSIPHDSSCRKSETLRNCVTFVKLRREVCSTKCAVMLACNIASFCYRLCHVVVSRRSYCSEEIGEEWSESELFLSV